MNINKASLKDLCAHLSRQFPQKFAFNGEFLEWLGTTESEPATRLKIEEDQATGLLFLRRVEDTMEHLGWLVSTTGKKGIDGRNFYVVSVAPDKDDAEPTRWGIGATREAGALRLLVRYMCGE